MMLSHLSPKECSSILPHLKLDARTPSTVTSLIELEREFQEIRERGYSTDCEEFIAGLISVAVPVRDSRGDVRAVIPAHAPSVRMRSEENTSELQPLIRISYAVFCLTNKKSI